MATSLCSDEVNRPLEESLYGYFGGRHFVMGGLAGYPFGGLTAFRAMTSHIPDQNGSCLLVYGPHVGISADGQVGRMNRRGKSGPLGTYCCGSAIAASRYVTSVYNGDAEPVSTTIAKNALDAQQTFVAASLLPYADQIVQALDPMVELPYETFQAIDDMMLQIVNAQAGDPVMGSDTRIALLGVRSEDAPMFVVVFLSCFPCAR